MCGDSGVGSILGGGAPGEIADKVMVIDTLVAACCCGTNVQLRTSGLGQIKTFNILVHCTGSLNVTSAVSVLLQTWQKPFAGTGAPKQRVTQTLQPICRGWACELTLQQLPPTPLALAIKVHSTAACIPPHVRRHTSATVLWHLLLGEKRGEGWAYMQKQHSAAVDAAAAADDDHHRHHHHRHRHHHHHHHHDK